MSSSSIITPIGIIFVHLSFHSNDPKESIQIYFMVCLPSSMNMSFSQLHPFASLSHSFVQLHCPFGTLVFSSLVALCVSSNASGTFSLSIVS